MERPFSQNWGEYGAENSILMNLQNSEAYGAGASCVMEFVSPIGADTLAQTKWETAYSQSACHVELEGQMKAGRNRGSLETSPANGRRGGQIRVQMQGVRLGGPEEPAAAL
jgi:hypothetical protein